jgi:ubiquinone/menaquinone biosynthesis C-methylase UbiE
MLVVGNENVQRATLTDRIKCELVNARGLPYAGGSFPAVISNSIIHHIPEPIDCIREMVRVCAPGGVIFVRDLLRPLDELNLRQLVNTYAGDANAHQKKMFADSLHAALDLSEIRDLVAQFGFPTNSVQATSDRHWTWSARKG